MDDIRQQRRAECERAVAEMFDALEESPVAVFFGEFSADAPFKITLTRKPVDEDRYMGGDMSDVEGLISSGDDGDYARWIDRLDEPAVVLDELVDWFEELYDEEAAA